MDPCGGTSDAGRWLILAGRLGTCPIAAPLNSTTAPPKMIAVGRWPGVESEWAPYA